MSIRWWQRRHLSAAVFLLALLLAGAALADVRIGREPGRTRVVLDLRDPVTYRQRPGAESRAVYFELDDTTPLRPPPPGAFANTPISDLVMTEAPGGSLRLAFLLERDDLEIQHFSLRPHGGRGHRLVIDFYAAAPADRGPGSVRAAVVSGGDAPAGGGIGNDPGAPKPAAAAAGASAIAVTPGPDRAGSEETRGEGAPTGTIAPAGADNAAAARPPSAGSVATQAYDPLPGEPGSWNQSALRPRGYAELSAAGTWPGGFRWSKLRARLEYGVDGRFGNGIGVRVVARAETDAAYFVEDDFYPGPVRDDQRHEFTLREAYIDVPAGAWELRLGRQHVVWGEMVGLFLADVVSAKDTREFYLQDFEAIRLPQWALRAEHFGTRGHLELVYVPYQTYDEVGKPGANFYPFPQLSGPVPEITPERGDPANHGYGARYSMLLGGWDLSGFAYRSTDVAPTLYQTGSGPELRHDRIQQYGATFSKDLRGVVLKGEAVYTRGRSFISLDPGAVQGVVASDALDYIVGVTVPRGDWNFDFQLYAAHRLDHERGMLYEADEFGATLLAGYQFGERVETQLLYLTGFNRSDQSVQGWVGWRFAPSWRLRAGVDWFDGEAIGFFGRYDNQDRAYLELKRWF